MQSRRNTNALSELVTKGFDEEQIWQQVELQNEDEMTHLFNGVSKILANNLIIPVCSTKPELISEVRNDELSQQEGGDAMFDDGDSENESELRSSLRRKTRKNKPSIVDDKFFKLQELDEYLNKEDRKEKRNESDDEPDDESVDLFNDFSEEEDDSSERKYIKYADFFDNPESENERHEENKRLDNDDNMDDFEEEDSIDDEMSEERTDKRVRFNLTNDSDETDSLENKGNQYKQRADESQKRDMAKEGTGRKSSLETRQERLLTRIKKLEDEAVAEKPWQLKGEVSGPNRPQNSLLEDFVEFDLTTRPAPVITEETTIKLEDIIKQRIKDKAWDDVEKKFKPVETPLEYKKKLILDQQKSKESLSQIYEKEYLKQKQALDPESNEKKERVPELHNEIKQLMHSLMYKLDALANYHYTPRRVRIAFDVSLYFTIFVFARVKIPRKEYWRDIGHGIMIRITVRS